MRRRLERDLIGIASTLGPVFLFGFVVFSAASAYLDPIYHWDLFGYIGASVDRPPLSAADVHGVAYVTVQNAAPANDFAVLTGEGPDAEYRLRQFQDPQAFATMLGFYKVKWLYVEAIVVLSRFMDTLVAIRTLSAASVAAAGALAAVWLANRQALHLGLLAVAAFMVLDLPEAARMGTPDALSAALIVGGVLAFVHNRESLAGVLLFAAFLARPDNAVFLAVLAGTSAVMRSFSWGAAAAFGAAALAYLPITLLAGHPGWWVHLWFTNVEFVETLEGFDPPFSLLAYAEILGRVIWRTAVNEVWPAVLIIGAAVWWLLADRGTAIFAKRESVVLVAAVLAVATKFVVFPAADTRHYMPYLLVFSLVLVIGVRTYYPARAWDTVARSSPDPRTPAARASRP